MGELPVGWCNTKFSEIAEATDYVANGSFATLKENVVQTNVENFAILVRLKDKTHKWKGSFKYVTKSSYEFLKKSDLIEGDLFIANVGAPGRSFLMPDLGRPMTIGPNGIRIRSGRITTNKYLHYFFSSPLGQEGIQRIVSGTAQKKFNKTGLRSSLVLLPPLNEQIRIANKLDSLLAKVEAAQTRLDKIPTLLKRFRQAVLAAATSGELTKEWREENKASEWSDSLLSELANSVSDGDHQAPPKAKDGIPFLVISNVNKGVIDFTNVSRWVPKEYFDSLKSVRTPELQDILYTVTGSYGIPVIVDTTEQFCFQRHIAIIKPNHDIIDYHYLHIVLASPVAMKQANALATGTAQKTVSLTSLRGYKIPVPPIEEQKQIVHQVESLSTLADKVEKQYQQARQRTDKLTQSLLAKAFKGELVPQDPNDESAEKLLARIQIEREKLKPAKKSRKSL